MIQRSLSTSDPIHALAHYNPKAWSSPVHFFPDEGGGDGAGGGAGDAGEGAGESLLGGGGDGGDKTTDGSEDRVVDSDWFSSLPDDLKGAKFLEQIKDKPPSEVIANVSKRFIDTQALVGKNKIELPDEADASDVRQQKVDAIYKALGVPDNAADYELKIDGLPEGYAVTDEQSSEFKEISHKLKLTPTQTQALLEWDAQRQVGQVASMNEAAKAERNKTEEFLRSDEGFGQAYDTKLKKVNFLVGKYGSDELKDEFNKTGVGNNPRLALFLARLSDEILGDQRIEGMDQSGGDVFSPAEAKAEYGRLVAKDSDHPLAKALRNQSDPRHKEAVEYRSKLIRAGAHRANKPVAGVGTGNPDR